MPDDVTKFDTPRARRRPRTGDDRGSSTPHEHATLPTVLEIAALPHPARTYAAAAYPAYVPADELVAPQQPATPLVSVPPPAPWMAGGFAPQAVPPRYHGAARGSIPPPYAPRQYDAVGDRGREEAIRRLTWVLVLVAGFVLFTLAGRVL